MSSTLALTETVRTATAADIHRLADTLGAAFLADPVLSWCYPDVDQRGVILPEIFRVILEATLPHGGVETVADEIAGAVWIPPAVEIDEEQLAVDLGRVSGEYAERVFTLLELLDAHHPQHEPHQYLFVLGTRPGWQSRGIGSALLRSVLADCDSNGMPAYLEATSERNRQLYERHGFEVNEVLRLPDGPPVWCMWRMPRKAPLTTPPDTDAREVFAERLVEDTTRSLETLSVYLGLALGLYRALAELGTATVTDVATRSGVARRYAREWLEQQATAGYLECANTAATADERRYRLPAAHAEVLLDGDSPFHAGPAARMFAGVAGVLPQLVAAYRSGGGVPYSAYGEIRQGISDLNRPLFRHELAGWLAALPRVDQRLRATPPAHVLDLGCGQGQSSIALALAYPQVLVHGVDLDEASVNEARREASAAAVDDRVTFTAGDAAHVAPTRAYDLVVMFETLHDMGDPVGALRSARAALVEDGIVFVGDDKVADEFTAPGDLLERFQFGWSVLHCLPATVAEDPVEANGTMLRSSTVARWAREAGFAEFAIPPISNDFWRFYIMSG